MTAGVVCLVKPGDHVDAGDPLLELRADDVERIPLAEPLAAAAVRIGPNPVSGEPIVIERVVR